MMTHIGEGIAIYQVGCFIALPTYLPLLTTSRLLKAMLQ
jgi:hypothetical protein